jgi:hypothetical protein
MNANLKKLYAAMLSLGNMYAEIDGEIFASYGNDTVPCTVDDMPLYLPTRKVLENSEGVKVFHILSEHIARPITPQMQYYITALNNTLNFKYMCLMNDLIKVCASPELHQSVKSETGRKLLSIGKDFKEGTQSKFKKLYTSNKLDFVKLYVKRNSNIGKNSYRRIALVTLPMCDLLYENEEAPDGCTLNKKEYAGIKEMVMMLFPLYRDPKTNEYSNGSNSDVATSADAVIGTLLLLIERFNLVAESIKSHLTYDNTMFDTSIINSELDFADYAKDINVIPRQDTVETAPVTNNQPAPINIPNVNNFGLPQMMNNGMSNVNVQQAPVGGTSSLAEALRNNPALSAMIMQQNQNVNLGALGVSNRPLAGFTNGRNMFDNATPFNNGVNLNNNNVGFSNNVPVNNGALNFNLI